MPEVIEIRKYADFINLLFQNKKLTDINIIYGHYKNKMQLIRRIYN